MRVRLAILVCFAVGAGFSDAASAETFSGRVIAIGGDVYPFQGVVFKLDHNGTVSPCIGGSNLESPWMYYRFTSNTDNGMSASDNLKGVYALVLSAWLSGQTITVETSGTAAANGGCAVLFVGPLRDHGN